MLLGFYHEQSRRDRNKYVRILWDNIITEEQHNFEKCEGCTEQHLPYDLNSIMHYGAWDSSKNGKKTIEVIGSPNYPIGKAKKMTPLDIRGVNILYGCYYNGKILLSKSMLSKWLIAILSCH